VTVVTFEGLHFTSSKSDLLWSGGKQAHRTTAQVVFSLLFLFHHPQLAEGAFQFGDLLVMDVTESCQLKLTILDKTAGASTNLGYAAGIPLLPRQRISFSPMWVARIA
jgi:hypothetical protein